MKHIKTFENYNKPEDLENILTKTLEFSKGYPIMIVGKPGSGKLNLVKNLLDDYVVILASQIEEIDFDFDNIDFDSTIIIDEFDRATPEVQQKIINEMFDLDNLFILLVNEIPEGLDSALMNKMIILNA